MHNWGVASFSFSFKYSKCAKHSGGKIRNGPFSLHTSYSLNIKNIAGEIGTVKALYNPFFIAYGLWFNEKTKYSLAQKKNHIKQDSTLNDLLDKRQQCTMVKFISDGRYQ